MFKSIGINHLVLKESANANHNTTSSTTHVYYVVLGDALNASHRPRVLNVHNRRTSTLNPKLTPHASARVAHIR